MDLIYITSDLPGAGKSALSLSLVEKLCRASVRAGYWKVCSDHPAADEDVVFARRVMSERVIDPVCWDSGDGMEQGKRIVDSLEGDYDTLVLDGASVEIPYKDFLGTAVKTARYLGARVLGIMGYQPSLNVGQLQSMNTLFEGQFLGAIVNSVSRYRLRETQQIFSEAPDLGFLGAIPEDRLMLSVTLGQIAGHIGAKWVHGEEKADSLVGKLLIGGNIMDSGNTYFGRGNGEAVIVRGDRPDIQLAALACSTSYLILTGDCRPTEYVLHEVERLDVPLLVVPQTTKATLEALDDVLELANFHHLDKLERFGDLLDTHCTLGDMIR